MLTVYGIKSCDTCRRAKKFLNENSIEFAFHDLREDGLDIQMLERWAARIEWQKMMNRKSLTWRNLPESLRQDMSKSRAFATMLEHPTLIKRPVLEDEKNFFAIGFSEKRFGDYLKKIA